MSAELPAIPQAVAALSPVYPFNEPGQPVVLHHGPVGGLAAGDAVGVVELSCMPDLGVAWRIEGSSRIGAPGSSVTLVLRRSVGDAHLPGTWRGGSDGWSNGTAIGDADAPLQRIVAHWFNLPDFHGPIAIKRPDEVGDDGWLGRWETEVGGWKLTLDVRPDHARVWRQLDEARIYVMTHVMEIRRADGAAFTADEADPVLTALHVGVSFALGQWAAPMLPVGEDSAGEVVWEEWRPYHCDPARTISPGWWYEHDYAPLADFLGLVIPAFADPARLPALRLQMMLGVGAMNDQGFVEQRIMMGAAGLEHIMWQTLVLEGGMSKRAYRKQPAHQSLRGILTGAHIPTDIDPELLPMTAMFATAKARQGKILDGADVVTQVRNRLVHPKGAREQIYRLEGLLAEAWLLIRHYLALLILHSLGYQGAYRDLRKNRGWAGEVDNVPWT